METFCVIWVIILIVVLVKTQHQQPEVNLARYKSVSYEQVIENIESELLSANSNIAIFDVTDEMREDAIKSAARIQEKFGRKFDFSPQSIHDVEYFCERAYQKLNQKINKGEDVSSAYKTNTRIWGNYFGEVVRRKYKGIWMRQIKQGKEVLPFVLIGNYQFDPYNPISKRLSKGSEYNILNLFKSTETLLAKNHLASENFRYLQNAFTQLSRANYIWQIITEKKTWDWRRNAGAGFLISRRQAKILQKNIPNTNSSAWIIRVDEKNDFYTGNYACFPELIFFADRVVRIEIDRQGKVTKSDTTYSEMQVSYKTTQFIEEDTPPSDSKVVGRTWKYVCKDGGPDLRFSGNRELPVFEYGELTIDISNNSIVFQVSNAYIGETFYKVLQSFVQKYKEPNQKTFENDSSANSRNQRETRNYSNKSPCEILGLPPNATLDEIIAAYRKLVQENHPDKVANMAPDFRALAEEKMKVLNSAYSELLKKYKQ